MVPTREEVLEAMRRMRKWQEDMEAESLARKGLEPEDLLQQADMFISIHKSLYELLDKYLKEVDYDLSKIKALNADILNHIGMTTVEMEIAAAVNNEHYSGLTAGTIH